MECSDNAVNKVHHQCPSKFVTAAKILRDPATSISESRPGLPLPHGGSVGPASVQRVRSNIAARAGGCARTALVEVALRRNRGCGRGGACRRGFAKSISSGVFLDMRHRMMRGMQAGPGTSRHYSNAPLAVAGPVGLVGRLLEGYVATPTLSEELVGDSHVRVPPTKIMSRSKMVVMIKPAQCKVCSSASSSCMKARMSGKNGYPTNKQNDTCLQWLRGGGCCSGHWRPRRTGTGQTGWWI